MGSPAAVRRDRIRSPLRIFGLVLLLVFAVEGLIMLILTRLPPAWQSPLRQSLVDATALTVTIAPALWVLVARPMQRALDQRSALLRRVATSQEEERNRIGRELHDGVGQQLSAIAVGLRGLEQAPELGAAVARLRPIRELAAQAQAEVRNLARGLRPVLVEELGLAAALERLAEHFRATHGIGVRLALAAPAPRSRDPVVEATLYRIAQEALSNAARHAGASSVQVRLEQGSRSLRLVVEDDGRGLPSDRGGGLGLASIRERTLALGGRFSLRSGPGRGTRLEVRIPLEP